jgi:hypothetical protein
VTESHLTDDDVSALEVLEAGGDLTEDQVGRLQALENTPFFAQTIQESEANSRRFAGAGFGPDGFVMSDTSSPMVQAQPDPVPPTGGPVREDKPAQQQPTQQPSDDGMQFDLITPPPIDAVEMETNIRGPRLGAMGPVSEAGDFYRDDEELLEAIKSASAKGIVLTREEFQTGQELEEQIGDSIGNLKTGAGNILSGLWEMAKGAAVEQGASPAAAIGQAIGSAAFDPTSAGKILVDGVKEATNRVVQGEVTKAEGARKAYIGVRQLWSWLDGTIENIEIDDDRRQAVRQDLIASKAFGQDNVANAQLLEAEVAKRKEQGLAPFAPTDKTAEYDTKYRRYWENEKLNRAYTGQNQYILDGKTVDERPDVSLSQLFTGYNPVTGEQIEPQPYTSMLYGMAMQPDTYVGFGAGYFSKLRVMSRAAAASRPLFGGIEVTAAKAAEAAKIGKDAQKFLRNSTIASGGLFTTGAGLSLNDNTGTLGKGLMFFGGILPAMRASGYVLKRVPVANRFLEAGGILRPQALRIIAEESKAGPLGAGSAANTPATQAAAIRAARPASAERLAASGEVPQRYARFMGTQRTRQGDLKLQNAGQRGFDSTLKRVAQNPENPANVRRAARTADELGLTQAFRATDDALGGAIAGVVGSAPFAAIAPDDQTAGGILAAGASLGAAGGMVSSFTSFRGDAVDADIARFLADTDALGGDPKALFQMPHKHLAAMSSLQGTAANKGVDVVALRTEDYNRMVPEAIGSQGYFSAPTAKDGSKAGRQRIFVDLGHSSLEEGTARITQAPDGMFELTVVRKDGSVAYPLPAADGQPVIRRKSADEFTVKDGDPISPYVPLNRQPPRIVTASHEFIHALMKSDMFGGDHQPALRGLIYEQYKPETMQSMAREYAQRLVDAQINNGRVIKPTNDEAKAKLIDDMVTELEDASVSSTGDRRAWIADEIVAETWQDIAQTIDVNRIRQGKSADGRVVDAARSAMIVATRALETFGMKFDWATGKPLTNPSTVFRDNPLATTPLLRKRILESVRNYDRYLTLLEDAGAVEAKGAPLPRSGRAQDWLAEGTMRVHRKADGTMENDVMTVDPDGQVRWKEQDQINNEYKSRSTAVSDLLKRLGTKLVDDNDPTFGLRRAGVGRTIYSGAELPMSNSPLGYPPVLAAFPEYYRTMYRDAVEAGRAGELVRLSNNTVGTRSDSGGPYQLSKLISSGFAKQSEGLFYGIQITKSGGHMNMQFVDTNAFKASALRAINDGQISFFNNDYKEVVRGLKQLMDNYRNKRDGSYMIGEEGKNILNGLLYGRSGANDGWGAKLNARGSIRTYRMDRMNWIERTGEDGYFFDNDRAKNNRMPETEPVDGPTMGGQAMPDVVSESNAAKTLEDLKRTSFIPTKVASAVLGGFPEYLRPVAQFITDQRAKLVEGRISMRDITKAYVMTISSQGSGARAVEVIAGNLAKQGIRFAPTQEFLTTDKKGRAAIRPEEAAAYWLGTESGQRALNNAERGAFDPSDWQEMVALRKAYGDDRFATLRAFAPENIARMPNVLSEINASKGNTDRVMSAVQKLNGISTGKKGFISHLLGIGDVPTIDAVEINFWLTGRGDVGKLTGKKADLVRSIKKYGDDRISNELFRRIDNRINGLRDQVQGGAEVAPEVWSHVMHHWLWDKAKKIETTHEGMYKAQAQFMPDAAPILESFDAANEATGGMLRPVLDQPENAPVVGRITQAQEDSIRELDEYYRKVTPQRIKELRNDAVDSLANRLINKGIPVAEARGLATETYKKIKGRVAGASQVISGMGTSDLSRMAGTGRPAVTTRKGVNPNWLTSAFEAFDTDNDLALMKAQQVARQLNKEQQAQVAAGQNVDAGRASGVRAATIDQGMKFVIGEKTADQKAFGSSLREDPAAPPRVYASVVEGQKFGSQGNYNVFFEWKKSAPIVTTSHHHYGVGNGLTDIHASANIGDKNARSFGNPEAEAYDTLPSGKKVLNTRLLVGNAGIDDIRAHQLMVSIPESSLSSLRSAYKTGKIGAVRQELNKTAVSQLVGSASQGKTQSFTSSEGVAPMVAIQRNRTEAYVLNPDLKNVASITIVSNSPKETALIRKNLAKAFENNGSSMPKIKVVSAESGASGNRGRSKITDEFFNLTGKVVYGAMLGGMAASQTDDNR